MICLIQIGVAKGTYLVDPFPLFGDIKSGLTELLHSPDWLKVVHGCANDVFALKKDFAVTLTGAVDIQLVHQEMMKVIHQLVGYGENERLLSIFGENEPFFERATGLKLGVTTSDTDLKKLAKSSSELIKLEKLAFIYFPHLAKPADATLADWRIRPLENREMINYATYDAHVTYYIWNAMKKLVSDT